MGRTVGSRWATPARPLRTACGVAAAGVYVLTPLPLDWHLTWSLDRLLLHLYPSLLLAAALRVVPPPRAAIASEPGVAPSPAPSPSVS